MVVTKKGGENKHMSPIIIWDVIILDVSHSD